MIGGKPKPSIFPSSCSPCSSPVDLGVSSLSGLRGPGWGLQSRLAASQHSLVPTVFPAGQSSLPGPEVSLSQGAAEHRARRVCTVTSEGALHPAGDAFAHPAVKASLTTEMIDSSLNRAPMGRETALTRR